MNKGSSERTKDRAIGIDPLRSIDRSNDHVLDRSGDGNVNNKKRQQSTQTGAKTTGSGPKGVVAGGAILEAQGRTGVEVSLDGGEDLHQDKGSKDGVEMVFKLYDSRIKHF